MVRIVVAKHSNFPGLPHRPGRQKTTCVGSSWAVVVEAVGGAGAVVEAEVLALVVEAVVGACNALAEAEPEAEAPAAGSGASSIVLMTLWVGVGSGEVK